MKTLVDMDYGPLVDLIGTWEGDKGKDVAPEPDGEEVNPYYETIVFKDGGSVTNGEEQDLALVHYEQLVQRKGDNKVIHHEIGYWMYDPTTQVIMHSLAIPRGLCLLAGGNFSNEKDENGNWVLDVSASVDDPKWGIVQSPFLTQKARTLSFKHKILLTNNKLSYAETTVVDIYGRVFEHTDANELTRV
ncbi:MAG: hypothetical protein CL840_01480 [Crocinitomicaceae bacterium]|nr:hypothetical protein [Crocinitomicaceae bacterium]|tara:strand:+ start:6080 stop:6646 length:567 start_codon:yes stop_codon:yes gene_type:complete